MTLVPETGTGANPLANSYVDLAYIKTWWQARGYTLPTDAVLEAKAFAAMDYIESKRALYQGRKSWRGQVLEDGSTAPVQPRQWPREGAQIDCEDIPNTLIPTELKDAQAAGSYEASQTDLLPTNTGALPIIRDKVGPIETEFSDALIVAAGGYVMPSFPRLDALLDPLINGCGGGVFLTAVRG